MVKSDKNKMIDKNTLLSVFKRMKLDPLKVFVVNEFFKNSPNKYRKYFNVLIALGVIEQVEAVYYCGVNKKARRNVKGYRLNRKN